MVTLINSQGVIKFEGLTASEAKRISAQTGFKAKKVTKTTKKKTSK